MTPPPAVEDRRPHGDGRARLAAVFADIASLTQVLRSQTETVAAETERWSLGLIESLQSVEPRLAEVRRLVDGDGAVTVGAPIAAIEHCGAIEALIEGTYAMVQVQDIVRQRLEAVTNALAALHAECQELASETGGEGPAAGLCACAALPTAGFEAGTPSPLSRIADRFDAISVVHRPVAGEGEAGR